MARHRKQAFTLIELMLVIGIIGILAGLLVPAVSRTKDTGRSAMCLNNLHQIGIALQLYVQDNNNRLPELYDRATNDAPPPGPPINQVLLPLVNGVSNVFCCPADRQRLFELTGSSYAWNNLLNGQDADQLQLLANAYPLHQICVVFDKEKFHLVHGRQRAVNFLYADGHINNLMELQSTQ